MISPEGRKTRPQNGRFFAAAAAGGGGGGGQTNELL